MIGRYTKTVPQVMIRWCLEQNYITIPRSSNEQRIIENSQVFDFKLEKEDFNAIVRKLLKVYILL